MPGKQKAQKMPDIGLFWAFTLSKTTKVDTMKWTLEGVLMQLHLNDLKFDSIPLICDNFNHMF